MNYDDPPALWTARPATAAAIQAGRALCPFLVAAGMAAAGSLWFPPSRLGVPWWLWGTIMSGLAAGTIVGVDRASRRWLPLVSLMRLTTVLPDEAPARYGLALRAFSPRQLDRRIREATEGGMHEFTVDGEPVGGGLVLLQLMAALGRHDRMTRGHSERVRAYADLIAAEMGLSADETARLRWSALLHDVGKLAVPSEILNKTGRLTPDEFATMRNHPEQGQKMCFPLAPWLDEWINVVGEHHERWDGAGYPLGLSGTSIHLGARIAAVADTFDVITSARSYKRPLTAGQAREEITACAGSQFDPEVVRAFLNIGLGRLRFEAGLLAGLASLSFIPAALLSPAALAGLGGVAATGAGVAVPWLADTRDDNELAFLPAGTADEPQRGSTSPIGTPPTREADGPGRDGTTPSPTEVIATTILSAGGQPTMTTIAGDSTVTTRSAEGPNPTSGGSGNPSTAQPSTGAGSAPTAVADHASVDEDHLLTMTGSGLLANDSDADGDAISIQGVGGATHGQVSLSGSLVTFAPQPNYYGPASFTYSVTDGVQQATASVLIDVRPAPDTPVASDDAYHTTMAMPLSVNSPGLLGNDSDPDGDAMSVRTNLVVQPLHGTVVVSSNGSFLYIPNPLFIGSDSFRYSVVDSTGRSDDGTVTISVT